jgi:branched-chain amino acid transport system permease protein
MTVLRRVASGGMATFTVWVAIGLLVPIVLGWSSTYRLGELEYILALLMLATGLNIVLGYAGQLFLGPSALFGVAGYAAAIVAIHNASLQNLWVMCLIGVIAALIVAAAVALPSLRIGGFYLGMLTLYLALVVPSVVTYWSLAGGAQGLSLVTDLNFVQSPTGVPLYDIGVIILAVLALYSWIIKHSRLGRRLAAIQASNEMAQSLGITSYTTKVTAFMLAAVPCGIAGAYYFYAAQFMNPSVITPNMSIDVLAGITIGGGGTVLGPIIGTGLVGAASQFLGGFNQYQGIVYGVALVGVAIMAPSGIMGQYAKLKARLGLPAGAPTGIMGEYAKLKARLLPARPAAPPVAVEKQTRRRRTVPQAAGAGGTSPRPSPRPEAEAPVIPLRATNVSRSFGGVRALDGVNLTVTPGVVHALVGPNGSGKTTLLNLISGFYRLHDGEICLGPQRLDTRRADEVARLGIARTFQTPKLLDVESALVNVVVACDRHAAAPVVSSVLHTPGGLRAERTAAGDAYAMLKEVGLDEDCFLSAGLLPHGTQRLLEIARAMALRPKFLLLDEPAAGLSAAEVQALSRAIRFAAGQGVGVLLVEHNLPVVFGLADHVTVLHQGHVIAEGTPSEVSADPDVVRIYIGRERLPADDRITSEGASS